MMIKDFKAGDEIAATALVELECEGKTHTYFISTNEGGKTVKVGDLTVNLISPRSPLGEELIGRSAEEILDVDTPHGRKSYFIVSIS